jgi:cell division protein FtsZ
MKMDSTSATPEVVNMASSTVPKQCAAIKVVGIGGGGCNAINRMIEVGVQGVDFIAMNTDAMTLEHSLAPTRLQLGPKLTRGLGTGGDPEKGQLAAEESRQEIMRVLEGADMVFVTAGMGGGTGTGGAPIVASVARDLKALTVGVVTKPFTNEGPRRGRAAQEGLARLGDKVDALIAIPNDRLRELSNRRLALRDAFLMADDILRQGVQGIAEIIYVTGDWNVDFEDVRTIVQNAGTALMGIGIASGQDRATKAAQAAISSPLLETSIQGARGALVNITAPDDFLIEEFDEITQLIRNATDPEEANIITGLVQGDSQTGEVKVTVIATGFGGPSPRSRETLEEARPWGQATPSAPPASSGSGLRPWGFATESRPASPAGGNPEPPQTAPGGPADAKPQQAKSDPAQSATPVPDLLEEVRRATREMGEGPYDPPTFLRDRKRRSGGRGSGEGR